MSSIASIARVVSQASANLMRSAKEAVKWIVNKAVPEPFLGIAKSARTLPPGRRGIYARRRLMYALGRHREVSLPPEIHSVVFVCHGNIMRSASAEQFLRDALESAGIDGVSVSSAGTNARDGKLADPRVREAARELGANLDEHRATHLTAEIVAAHDVIFAMDEFNYANIACTFPESKGKLLLLGGVNSRGVYFPHEIEDPYVKGQSEVIATIEMIQHYVSLLAGAIAARQHLQRPLT